MLGDYQEDVFYRQTEDNHLCLIVRLTQSSRAKLLVFDVLPTKHFCKNVFRVMLISPHYRIARNIYWVRKTILCKCFYVLVHIVTHVPIFGRWLFHLDWCMLNSVAGRTSSSPVWNMATRLSLERMCGHFHMLSGSSWENGELGSRNRSALSPCARVVWLGGSLVGAISSSVDRW